MTILSSMAGLGGAALAILIFQTDVVKNAHGWNVVWVMNMAACAIFVGALAFFGVKKLKGKGER